MVMDDPDVIEKLRKAFNKAGVEDDDLVQAAEHGSDAGIGLVYYSETSEFYEANEENLWELLAQEAEEMGYKGPLEFMSNWKGAEDIATDSQFRNAVVWFAQEAVGDYIQQYGVEKEEE